MVHNSSTSDIQLLLAIHLVSDYGAPWWDHHILERANLGPSDNLDYYEELNGYNNETHASPVLHLVISKFTNEKGKGFFYLTS